MDKDYEWEELKIRPPPIRPIVETQPRKRPIKDAQQNIKGFCPCGRSNGTKNAYRLDPRYCSRFCFEFMTFPAEGYKKKTRYDFWKGTGKYAYNPPWPKLEASCVWCNETYPLTRNTKDANRLYCGMDCMRQGKRNAKGTSKRIGSTQIALRVRTMIILREFSNEYLTADEIAYHYREWFRLACSASKIASSIKTLIKNGWVSKIHQATQPIATYAIVNTTTPLKKLFGESETSRC